MTTIVNYGAGNIRSVENTLAELGAEYEITDDPSVVRQATKIILPGVGHFGQMMQAIDKLGLRQPLKEKIHSGIPFLGICVGLQCLFETSEEAPGEAGLRHAERRRETIYRSSPYPAYGLELARTGAPHAPAARFSRHCLHLFRA